MLPQWRETLQTGMRVRIFRRASVHDRRHLPATAAWSSIGDASPPENERHGCKTQASPRRTGTGRQVLALDRCDAAREKSPPPDYRARGRVRAILSDGNCQRPIIEVLFTTSSGLTVFPRQRYSLRNLPGARLGRRE